MLFRFQEYFPKYLLIRQNVRGILLMKKHGFYMHISVNWMNRFFCL